MHLDEVLREEAFTAPKAPGTLRNYRDSLAVLRRLGVEADRDATPEKVARFLSDRLTEVLPQTARKDFVFLCGVLGYLERTDRFPLDRLRRVRRLKPHVPPPGLLCAPHLTRDEVDRLLAVARPGGLAALTVTLAVFSGLRAGELCRLRWSDVDMHRRVLVVRSSLASRTKTGRSRVVTMPRELATALSAARRDASDFVLGPRQITVRAMLKRVTRLGAIAGVTVTTLLLRHTRASWLAAAGVPLLRIAKQLGHSPEVCARFYAGLTDGFDSECDRAA
jgi:integrase